MQQIFSLIRQIVILFLLAGLIRQLMPDSSYYPYFRLYIGLILVIWLCGPLLQLIQGNLSLEDRITSWQWDIRKSEIRTELPNADQIYRDYLIQELEQEIRRQVTELLLDRKVTVEEVRTELNTDPESSRFGSLNHLTVIVSDSDILQENTDRLKNLKEALSDRFEIEMVNVEIRVQ